MIWIDSHVHIGEDKDGNNVGLEEIKEMFSEEYIDKAIAFCFNEKEGIKEGNKKINQITKEEDRIKGLLRIDPERHSPEDLKNLHNFSGFKLHPHSQNFEMKEIKSYLKILDRLKKPLVIHIGHWGEKPHPEEVVDVANELDSPIILAHSIRGYYFKADKSFINKLKKNKNIYIDLSFQASHSAIEVLTNDLGANRLLFASDYPYGHPIPIKRSIQLADISEKDKQKIAYKNAVELFF